jgi:site-specific DNA-methyltransferase (adenine-specific)
MRVETIGEAVLYLGDALEVLPAIPAESVDMIWTDPPYGHGNMDGDLQAARVSDAVKGGRRRIVEPIANDRGEGFETVMQFLFTEAKRILKRDCCCCCCCCGGGGPKPTFAQVAQWMDSSLSFFHAVVWDKSARGNGMGWRYRRNYEFVMVGHRKGGRLSWANENQAVPNVVRHMPVLDREHPNEKPVELVADFIAWHTERGDVVCDPMMGSGTTGVACANLGRRFIGVEIEPKYFDIACRRISDAYKQPRLIEDEQQPVRQTQLFDGAAS